MTLQEMPGFAKYLRRQHAAIQPNTNPWDVLRYWMEGCGTIVISKDSREQITAPSISHEHWASFKNDLCLASPRALGISGRVTGPIRDQLIAALVARDGENCCFCGWPLGDDVTVEHWLAIANGGNSSLANTALAHADCNQKADNLAVLDKIRLRDRRRVTRQVPA